MIDISVVIPTFRRQEQLLEAIESVLAQKASIEIIVIDDSPEGSAREVVKRFENTPLVYVNQNPPTGGKPALVRNSGWPMAQGRVVHFLDDDDRVADGFYKDAIDTFDAHPGVGVIFGCIEPFANNPFSDIAHERNYFSDAARRSRIASRIASKHWMVANLLFKPTLLVNSACLIRRELIEPLAGYDASLGLNEDVDFYCRAIRRFGFKFLDQVVLRYRINSDSLMHGRPNNDKLLDAYRKMHNQYRKTHGTAEFLALKLFARTVLTVV